MDIYGDAAAGERSFLLCSTYKLCMNSYLAFISGVFQAKTWRPMLHLAVVGLAEGGTEKKYIRALEKRVSSWAQKNEGKPAGF